MVTEEEKKKKDERQQSKGKNIGSGNGEDVAEQVFRQIGTIAGGEEGEYDADGHSQRPEHGNGGVLPYALFLREPLNAEGGKNGEDHGRQDGGQPEEKADPQPAERGVRDTAADKYQPLCHYVNPDHPAGNASEETAPERIAEKSVIEELKHVH